MLVIGDREVAEVRWRLRILSGELGANGSEFITGPQESRDNDTSPAAATRGEATLLMT